MRSTLKSTAIEEEIAELQKQVDAMYPKVGKLYMVKGRTFGDDSKLVGWNILVDGPYSTNFIRVEAGDYFFITDFAKKDANGHFWISFLFGEEHHSASFKLYDWRKKFV